MIRLKNKNVNIKELKAQLKCKIFDIALTIRKIEGEDYTVVITSGNDGKHMKHSKHYSNEAIDIRTNNMVDPDTVALRIKITIKTTSTTPIKIKIHTHTNNNKQYIQPIQTHQTKNTSTNKNTIHTPTPHLK